MPSDSATPNKNIPINFCPSCAPCINAIAAAPAMCEFLKNFNVICLCIFLHTTLINFATKYPSPKPNIVESTSP